VARTHIGTGKPVPPVVISARQVLRRDNRTPQMSVQAFAGEEAVLLIQNDGGDAEFRAEGQIVGISPGNIRHTAPYQMRWRNPKDHKTVRSHNVVITNGERLKLILASYSSGGDWGKPGLQIIGDEWVVDDFRYQYGESPIVTIELAISAQPALATEWRRQYSVWIPKDLYAVQVCEA